MSKKLSLLRFVDSHSWFHSTLSASACLWRLETLLDEIGEIEAAIGGLQDRTGSGRTWNNLDIFSYYTVAFVTCLEWHARARLVDLIRAHPDKVEDRFIKVLNDSEMVKRILARTDSAALLVAANFNVGSAEDYLSVFRNLAKAIGSPEPEPWNLVRDEAIAGGHNMLEDLFAARHELVHEITVNHVGHWLLRAPVELVDAKSCGQMCLKVILALERHLTDHAPISFPRLLDKNGSPISEVSRLGLWVASLEARLEKSVEAEYRQSVKVLIAKSIAGSEADDALVNDLVPHNRYYDFKEPIKAARLEARIRFLRAILDEFAMEESTVDSGKVSE